MDRVSISLDFSDGTEDDSLSLQSGHQAVQHLLGQE